ncbi:MAG: hypothetical protein ABW109_16505, partial [Candidatus Thiodiazotropha sp. 6PLUC4]
LDMVRQGRTLQVNLFRESSRFSFAPLGEALSSLNTAARSLDEVQRNPGEHCTNLPGFRCTPTRLPYFSI